MYLLLVYCYLYSLPFVLVATCTCYRCFTLTERVAMFHTRSQRFQPFNCHFAEVISSKRCQCRCLQVREEGNVVRRGQRGTKCSRARVCISIPAIWTGSHPEYVRGKISLQAYSLWAQSSTRTYIRCTEITSCHIRGDCLIIVIVFLPHRVRWTLAHHDIGTQKNQFCLQRHMTSWGL